MNPIDDILQTSGLTQPKEVQSIMGQKTSPNIPQGGFINDLYNFAVSGSQEASKPFKEAVNFLLRKNNVPFQFNTSVRDLGNWSTELGKLSGVLSSGLIATPGMTAAGAVSPLAELSGWGALGAAETPEHPYLGAATGVVGGLLPSGMAKYAESAAKPYLGQAIQSLPQELGGATVSMPIAEKLSQFTETPFSGVKKKFQTAGEAINKNANDTFNNLLNGENPENIPDFVKNEVKQNYANKKAQDKANYQDVENYADKIGFFLQPKNMTSTHTALNDIQKFMGTASPTTQKDVGNLIDTLTSSPMQHLKYNDLRNAIIKYGENGSSHYSAGNLQDSAIYNILRNGISQDLENTAVNSGNQELYNKLKASNLYHKNEVTPYYSGDVFGKIISQPYVDANIGNILTKGSNIGVLKDLSPKTKDLLLFDKLKGASVLTPEGDISTDANSLWNAYSSFRTRNPQAAANLVNPESHNQLMQIGKNVQAGKYPLAYIEKQKPSFNQQALSIPVSKYGALASIANFLSSPATTPISRALQSNWYSNMLRTGEVPAGIRATTGAISPTISSLLNKFITGSPEAETEQEEQEE